MSVKYLFFRVFRLRSYGLCSLMLLTSVSLLAQIPTPLHFKSLTINDGLSQGYVSSITQDKEGFIWFATGDGLNKYDGYSFTVYHHDPDDSTSIASDDLTYVFEDSKQRLWIGTRNNGLEYFDRRTNTFYHFRKTNLPDLISDKIGVLSEDKTGALWVSTDLGIDRLEIVPLRKATPGKGFFNEYTPRFTHIRADKNFVEKKPDELVRGSFFTDAGGHTFVATRTRIYELVFNADNTYRFIKKFETPALHADFLSVIMEDTSSHSLFMNGESVIRFPGHDFSLPSLVYDYNIHDPGHVCIIDKKQMIWMVDGNGIRRIHIPDNEKSYYISADSSLTDALRTTICMFSDAQGVLWIGTSGYGILKYDPEKERFHHILPDTRQYQILEIRPGTIMTNNFQKVTLNKSQTPRLEDDAIAHALRRRFHDHNIIRFTKDTSGSLWIPDGRNIYYYDIRTKAEHIYNVAKEDDPGKVYPLYADKNNRLWFGLRQQFFRFIPPAELSAVNYPLRMSNFEDDFLQTIYEDGNVLWFGTIHGIFRYNTITDSIEREYYFQSNDSTSISNNFIYCFCNDEEQPERYLWIGTKGGGLNRLDKTTGKFVRYNTKNGLVNNVVYGILPGDDGNLWLSTNKGLSAFNPGTRTFRNYDVEDGLQSNEFNRYAYCKTSNGLLVFGGMNGINYFDPKEIKPLDPPDIIFTDFRLFNKPVNIKDPDAPLKQSINYAGEITLKYKQNAITFQFAAMDYRRGGNIVYRYRMEGFDKDWNYSGTAHEATYTNLNPGKYRFIVQASFDNNLWGKKERSIAITIITPWYRTWWFYVSIALILSAATYGLYRFRLHQLRRLDKLRNRIAMDLHDEVGSSISTISIYSKIMQQQIRNVDFDNKPLVDKINEFAVETMESMNDIVWNINTNNDAFELIISRMRVQAAQLLEIKGYTVHFDYDEAFNRMKLNMDKRREFYLIYKEIINNISKYADGENVWINLFFHSGFIILAVKDDGKGFEINNTGNNGNGLNNIQHRAKTLKGDVVINTSPGKGTEVRLRFYTA